MSTHQFSSEDDPRLNEVIGKIEREFEAGRFPDRMAFLAAHPEFADEIRSFFAIKDEMLIPSTEAFHPSTETFDGDDSQFVQPNDLHPLVAERQHLKSFHWLGRTYTDFERKHGAMGEVYIARNVPDAEAIAVKTVMDFARWRQEHRAQSREELWAAYQRNLELFRREAEVWVELGQHQNILQAIAVVVYNGKPHIVTEFANSGDLATWIKRGLSVSQSVAFSIQFCWGMATALQRGLRAHRDLKPGNILICDDRILKVADFGLAKAFDRFCPPSSDRTDRPARDSSLAGTRRYMAPELFAAPGAPVIADQRSDVFSFGITMFEMVTGRLPFAGEPRDACSDRVCAPAAHKINRSVPPQLSRIISQCLDFDPRQRYQTFELLGEELLGLYQRLPDRLPLPSPATISREVGTSAVALQNRLHRLISFGEYSTAAGVGREACRLNGGDFSTWLNLGFALAKCEEHDEAAQCFQRAIKIGTPEVEETARAWTNLSYALQNLNRWDEALHAAEQAIQQLRTFDLGWAARGACMEQLGRLTEAIESLQQVTTITPDSCLAHFNIARCYTNIDRFDEAASHFERAAQLNPDDPAIWRHLASAYFKQERDADARGAVDRCLEIDPKDADAWVLRGFIFWDGAEDLDTAEMCFKRALEIDPKSSFARTAVSRLLTARGQSLKENGNVNEVLKVFEKAAELSEDNAEAWFEIAWCHAHADNWKLAEQPIRRSLSLCDSNVAAWTLCGFVDLYGNAAEAAARECFERVIDLEPDNAMARNALHQLS